jgi:hypothetical protein
MASTASEPLRSCLIRSGLRGSLAVLAIEAASTKFFTIAKQKTLLKIDSAVALIWRMRIFIFAILAWVLPRLRDTLIIEAIVHFLGLKS